MLIKLPTLVELCSQSNSDAVGDMQGTQAGRYYSQRFQRIDNHGHKIQSSKVQNQLSVPLNGQGGWLRSWVEWLTFPAKLR